MANYAIDVLPFLITIPLGLVKVVTGVRYSIPKLHKETYTGISAWDYAGPNDFTLRTLVAQERNGIPAIIFPHTHGKIHEWFKVTYCEFENECFLILLENGKLILIPLWEGKKFEAPPGTVHGIWVGRGKLEMEVKVKEFKSGDIKPYGVHKTVEDLGAILFPRRTFISSRHRLKY